MTSSILKDAEERMKKAVDVLARDFKTIRAGRATPSLLDRVSVDYYGVDTPLNQLANISTPDPKTLVIQPWDKTVMGNIEKSILKSDLGLTPNNDGNIIRLSIPDLTQERRRELVKVIKKKAEEGRVSVRNIRRDANDSLKDMEKNKDISEDELRGSLDEVQKVTDKYIKEVDSVLEKKEKDIMEV